MFDKVADKVIAEARSGKPLANHFLFVIGKTAKGVGRFLWDVIWPVRDVLSGLWQLLLDVKAVLAKRTGREVH